ncbi:MAG: FprA family A-type flavoprotein [Acutalibacteraceae bacterium]|jgi:flavorubredoxin
MGTIKITENICSVGVQNPTLRVFDIIMQTEFGTSYNAYFVKGSQKTALIDAVHLDFFDEYLENISGLTDVSKIDYLIVNHTEPDHSGSIKKLMELNPDITVIASTAGQKFLSAITNMQFNAMVVRGGETIDLGGLSLEFISAPLLHWPDSIFTWCPEEKVLFSCDFLGAHYSEPRMFDYKLTYPEEYAKAFKEYFDVIFSPFKPNVRAGLDKIRDLDISLICTSHGPVLTKGNGLEKARELYRTWSAIPVKDGDKSVVILYVSAYGCTKKVAEVLEEELRAKYGFNTELVHVSDTNLACIKSKIDNADGILLGTPTINRDALKPMWEVTTVIDAIANKGKPAGVFGSFGWSGEGVPMLVERLKGLNLDVVGDGLRVNFVPDEDEILQVREYAKAFAEKSKA